MLDSLGPHTLGCNVGSLTGLTELSPSEYGALPKELRGERIFKAPGVHFLGCDWDIAVGSVGRTIYKIQAQIMFEDDGESRKTFQTTYAYCEQELGQPTRHKDTMTIWTTDEGNVVLGYFGEGTPFRAVNLALTSAKVVQLSKGHQDGEPLSQEARQRIKLYENWVLKPLYFLTPNLGIAYLVFQRAWVVGALLLCAGFVVWMVARNKEKTGKVILPTGAIIALTSTVLFVHHGIRTFIAVPLGVVLGVGHVALFFVLLLRISPLWKGKGVAP